jgi:hypothetical protein
MWVAHSFAMPEKQDTNRPWALWSKIVAATVGCQDIHNLAQIIRMKGTFGRRRDVTRGCRLIQAQAGSCGLLDTCLGPFLLSSWLFFPSRVLRRISLRAILD